jgi:hypothetical protein
MGRFHVIERRMRAEETVCGYRRRGMARHGLRRSRGLAFGSVAGPGLTVDGETHATASRETLNRAQRHAGMAQRLPMEGR